MAINKQAEKEFKANLKRINKISGTKISYKDLRKKVEELMAKTGKEREDAFTKAYTDLTTTLSSNLLREAIVHGYNLSYPGRKNSSDSFSITIQTKNAKALINEMCDLLSPGYYESHPITDSQLDAIRDYELETLNAHTFHSDLEVCLTGWNEACYAEDTNTLEAIFPDSTDHVYSENKNDQKDITAAEYYKKAQLTQARLDKHGKLWRWFHPGKVRTYTNYIQNIHNKLNKIGFDPAKHGEASVELLKGTIIRPIALDPEAVEHTHKKFVIDYRKDHTPPLTIGREKFKKARELDANPNTSLDKELEPLLDKYNLDKLDILDDTRMSDLEKGATTYDTTRFIDGYTDTLTSVYVKSYQAFAAQAGKNTGNMNVREIISDARKVMITVAKRYTPVLESKSFADLKKPFYQNIKYPERLANQFERVNRLQKLNLSQEKLDAILKEANDLINEWKADPKKVVLEDIEMGRNPDLLSSESASNDSIGIMENSQSKEKLSISFDSDFDDFDISKPIDPPQKNSQISLS